MPIHQKTVTVIKMYTQPKIFWLLFLSLPMLIACGSDKYGKSVDNEESYKPITHTVTIQNMRFSPATLTVSIGDSVEWINKDIFAHDVTSESDEALTSGLLESGKQYKIAVDKDYAYLCSIHPSMKAIILVN